MIRTPFEGEPGLTVLPRFNTWVTLSIPSGKPRSLALSTTMKLASAVLLVCQGSDLSPSRIARFDVPVREVQSERNTTVPRPPPPEEALLRAVSVPGGGKRAPGRTLAGESPSPLAPPHGCPFHPRCTRAQAICSEERPSLAPVADDGDHGVACHFAEPET